MAAGFRAPLFLLALVAVSSAPAPPAPAASGATPGPLTPQQIAHLRGAPAQPWRLPEERRHHFSTTQLTCSPEEARLMRTAQRLIAPADLAPGEGLEAVPHITIRYGLETDAPGPVVRVLSAYAPLTVQIGALHVFEPEDEDYDVLVLRVESAALREMNLALQEADIPQTDTQARYVPHLTLGYVRKGMGVAYRGLQHGLTGQPLTFATVDFIDRDGVCTTIPLLREIAQVEGDGVPLPAVATAQVVDPDPNWTPLLALSLVDLHRRQAEAREQADAEALLLMLVLLEEV